MNYLSLIKSDFQIVTTRCLIIAFERYRQTDEFSFFILSFFCSRLGRTFPQNATAKLKEMKPNWRTVFRIKSSRKRKNVAVIRMQMWDKKNYYTTPYTCLLSNINKETEKINFRGSCQLLHCSILLYINIPHNWANYWNPKIGLLKHQSTWT